MLHELPVTRVLNQDQKHFATGFAVFGWGYLANLQCAVSTVNLRQKQPQQKTTGACLETWQTKLASPENVLAELLEVRPCNMLHV